MKLSALALCKRFAVNLLYKRLYAVTMVEPQTSGEVAEWLKAAVC